MIVNNDISPAWWDWIKSNLQRGCTQQSMIESMVQKQFDASFAAASIARVASGEIDISKPWAPLALSNDLYRYERSRIVPGNTIVLSDRLVKVALRLNRPDVVLIDGFMSDKECEELIEQSRHKLLPSTIADPLSGDMRVTAARTSQGTKYQRGETLLVQRLENRISKLMNWPLECGEGIQVLRYQVGAEYRVLL